jgi:hypothetical protein
MFLADTMEVILAEIGMAMGRVRIGYGKYPPATIPAGITHTRPRLYPRVGFCTRARTHRVSGGYNYTPLLGMNLDCSTSLIYPVNVLISH